MTRLAILSDIHGNLPALEAVLGDMQPFAVDQVIVPGDVINFGPFSRQTAEFVIAQGWPVIRGNNEFFLIDYHTPRAPAAWWDPVQFAPLAWLDRQFDQPLRNRIAAWPDSLTLRYSDAPPLEIIHGTPQDPWEPIYGTMTDAEIERLIGQVQADYLICGHTHLPMDRQVARWRIFNPGSVGVPLDGLFSASYLILDGNPAGWEPTFRRVPFPYDGIYQEFEDSGYNAQAGPIGRLTVEIYRTARPMLGFLRWQAQCRPGVPLSDALVDEFLASVDWSEYAHPAYHLNLAGPGQS